MFGFVGKRGQRARTKAKKAKTSDTRKDGEAPTSSQPNLRLLLPQLPAAMSNFKSVLGCRPGATLLAVVSPLPEVYKTCE